MNATSPYLPPSSEPPPVPRPGGLAPPAVKVFGIMHLIMAGIGVLTVIWSLVSAGLGINFVDESSPGAEAQLRYQRDMMWITVLTAVFQSALAVLLVISGAKLVGSRPDGVRWSNRYAWTSIVTKVISAVIAVIFMLPATAGMMEETMRSAPGGAGAGEQTVISVIVAFTSIAVVAGPLVGCLYPALALFFLSRPAVKQWTESAAAPAATSAPPP